MFEQEDHDDCVDAKVETKSKKWRWSILPLKDVSDDNQAYGVRDDNQTYVSRDEIIITRHALSVQVNEEETKKQRENIFHNRFHVNNKVCVMIIDGGVVLM